MWARRSLASSTVRMRFRPGVTCWFLITGFFLGLRCPCRFLGLLVVSRETKEVVWEWKDRSTGGPGFFSPFMGSAQKLEGGGDVLLCEAETGRSLEVTEAGETVWEFVVPQLSDYKGVMGDREWEEMEQMGFAYQSNAIFRAYKYRPEEVPWLS